jgi:hypothetical protein
MKKQLLLFLLLISFSGFISSAQDCYWSSQAGGKWWDGGRRIAIDGGGNTYVAGITRSNFCYFNTDTLRGQSNNTLFVVKYNGNGLEVWVKEISGGNFDPEDYIGIGGMRYDSLTHCLLINGTFYNQALFGDTLLTGLAETVFTLKMDLNGEIVWARAAGGEGEDQAMDLVTDEQGNVYISGTNQNPATFTDTTIARGGFLAKYDSNGNLVWAKNISRYQPIVFSESPPQTLSYGNQQLFVNGIAFNDTIVIDTITIINTHGSLSTYLASFSPQGQVEWIRLAGQSEVWCGYQMPTDKNGSLYITGLFKDIGIFGDDTIRNNIADDDCFLAKYSYSGNLIWVRQLFSTSLAYGLGLATDNGGNVYLSGYFKGSATFGETTLVSGSIADMFVTRFSPDGNCDGVRQYTEGRLQGILLDQNNNLFLTGGFYNELTIGSNTFISRGDGDLFVAKCSEITGEEELKINPQNQLLIYANPNTGRCNITIPEEFANEKNLVLQIFDLQGKLIQQSKIEIVEGKIRLDIRAQAKGMYTAVLSNGKRSYTGKIVFE